MEGRGGGRGSAKGPRHPGGRDAALPYASWQLFNLCLGDIHLHLLFGLLQDLPQVALETQLERAVDNFLVLYGPIGPDR